MPRLFSISVSVPAGVFVGLASLLLTAAAFAAEAAPSDVDLQEPTPPAQQVPADGTADANRESQTPAAKDNVVDQPALTAEQTALRDRLRRCLAYYFHRPETTRVRSPWAVMHCIIGFGVDTPLMADGNQVNAIAWLCANGPCYGMRMLSAGEPLSVHLGPGYQGHHGQFLAILAQSRVKIDYPLIVGGRQMTIADLVKHEQATCEPQTELTFKLISLAHYLPVDATWTSQTGEAWDIPRLIKEELSQPIVGAACGGTHRLMGFSYAVRKREKSGEPLTGQWSRAKKYVDDFHAYTFKLQNADGSFSTSWFAGRGDSGDIERRLNTTGHTLEWLAHSLPKEQLTEPPTVQAVNYLVDLLWQYRGHAWEIGPKGHAIHALSLYDERVFGGQPGNRALELVQPEVATENATPARREARTRRSVH